MGSGFADIIAEIVVINGHNRVTAGTAFYIGKNLFISAYHCIEGYLDSEIIVFWGKQTDGIKVIIEKYDTEQDIVLLKDMDELIAERRSLPFAYIEELPPLCKFVLLGFSDRDKYPEHVPAFADGSILNSYSNFLVVKGDGLDEGMSGAPLIVGNEENPRIAGMFQKNLHTYIEPRGSSFIIKEGRGIVISSEAITKFLSECSQAVSQLVTIHNSREESQNSLCALIKSKSKIVLRGIMGIGKRFILDKAIKSLNMAEPILIQGIGGLLTLNDFIDNPSVRKQFGIYFNSYSLSELMAFINNKIIQENSLNQRFIQIVGFDGIDEQLNVLLKSLKISVVIIEEKGFLYSDNWIVLNICEMSYYETSHMIRNLSEGKKIGKLSAKEFEELSSDIYQTCGGIPLLVKWVCAEVNKKPVSAKYVLSKIASNDYFKRYYQFLDNTINDENAKQVLCAISIGIKGISLRCISYITGLQDEIILSVIEKLYQYNLIVVNDSISDINIRYKTHQIVFNYFLTYNADLIFYEVDKYIDYYSDYANNEDYNNIDLDVLWLYFFWSERYNPDLFVKWMYAFSYYFFETGRLLERKKIGARALDICERSGNQKDKLWCIVNEIAYIDYVQGNYAVAKSLLEQNIGLAKTLSNNPTTIIDRFNSKFILSLFYRYLGLIYSRISLYEDAQNSFHEAELLLIELNRLSVNNNLQLEIGELLLIQEKYQDAYEKLLQTLVYYETNYINKQWMLSWLARNYLDLAKCCYGLNQHVAMSNYLEKSIDILRKKSSKLIDIELHLFMQRLVDKNKGAEVYRKIRMKANKIGISIDKIEKPQVCNNNLLIILTKYPFSGRSKTRLISDIGLDKGTKIAEAMLIDTFESVQSTEYDILVCPPVEDLIYDDKFHDILPEAKFYYVLEGGLRGKNSNLFEQIQRLLQYYKKVVLVYSDTPFVTKDIIYNVIELLNSYDVIIGTDGAKGYYLVGMRKLLDIFTPLSNLRIPYLDGTIEIIENYNASYKCIWPLKDLDTIDDIASIPWKDNVELWKKTQETLKGFGLIE